MTDIVKSMFDTVKKTHFKKKRHIRKNDNVIELKTMDELSVYLSEW